MSKEKKAQRKLNKEGLQSYYTVVVNNRTRYTKLVSNIRALDYTLGKPGYDGVRKPHMKDTYTELKVGKNEGLNRG